MLHIVALVRFCLFGYCCLVMCSIQNVATLSIIDDGHILKCRFLQKVYKGKEKKMKLKVKEFVLDTRCIEGSVQYDTIQRFI